MPTTDTVPDYTDDQARLHDAYLARVADHNILCARKGATARERLDAASRIGEAYRAMMASLGHDIGDPSDTIKLRDIREKLGMLTESIRSAHAMLQGIGALGVFDHLPEGERREDHDACHTLLSDTTALVRDILKRADAL